MKIGLLTTYLALGEDNDSGIGQHYRILADTLSQQGHKVHVVYATFDGERARVSLASLAPTWTYDVVEKLPPNWLLSLFRWSWPSQLLLKELWAARAADKALHAACKKHSLEVVETHAYNAPSFFFNYRRRRPWVVTRVSTTIGQMNTISTLQSRVLKVHARLERSVTKHSDTLLTHTIQHRDTVCAKEGYDPTLFEIVPHGLPDPGEPASYGVYDADGHINFLFVGRFESRKGVDVLLAAIPAIISEFPKVRLTLAGSRGDGLDWQAFEQSHPELAGTSVVSLGRVSAAELVTLYQKCAVLVAPSRYESFGLIYAEAMSHGKPVIGCKAGGVPEVVTDGSTGLLAEPGDVPSLIACMRQLAGDANLRERMGKAARADFLRRFSARQLAEASVALYQKVAGVNSSRIE